MFIVQAQLSKEAIFILNLLMILYAQSSTTLVSIEGL